MKFVLPVVLLLFSLAFAGAWFSDRGRRYLLSCCLCFLLIGLAMLIQLSFIPSDSGINSVLSTTLYVLGTLAGGHGVLKRSGLRLPPWFAIFCLTVIAGGTAFFYYVAPHHLTRVYLLNFGLAAMIFVFVWYLRALIRGPLVDRLVLFVLLAVGLQFIPRTLLTASSLVGDDTGDFAFTAFWQWTVFTTAVAAVIAGFVLFAAAGADRYGELVQERDTDALTGLINRRGLEARIKTLLARKQIVFGWVAVCDIDYFKMINDAYGHMVGDAVLKNFAEILQSHINGFPISRIGGEEFVIFLGEMTGEEAYRLLESVREDIAMHRFPRLAKDQGITCSFGSVRLTQGEDIWLAIERADKLLYAAKKAGRNRIFIEGVNS